MVFRPCCLGRRNVPSVVSLLSLTAALGAGAGDWGIFSEIIRRRTACPREDRSDANPFSKPLCSPRLPARLGLTTAHSPHPSRWPDPVASPRCHPAPRGCRWGAGPGGTGCVSSCTLPPPRGPGASSSSRSLEISGPSARSTELSARPGAACLHGGPVSAQSPHTAASTAPGASSSPWPPSSPSCLWQLPFSHLLPSCSLPFCPLLPTCFPCITHLLLPPPPESTPGGAFARSRAPATRGCSVPGSSLHIRSARACRTQTAPLPPRSPSTTGRVHRPLPLSP